MSNRFPLGHVNMVLVWLAASGTAIAQEPVKTEAEMTKRGLEWLIRQQADDGAWRMNDQFPTAMTGFAGMALLSEGSTRTLGKYSAGIEKATQYLLGNAQPDGRIASKRDPSETSRTMHVHAPAIQFLANLYASETDPGVRARLEKVLNKAVEFSADAQTTAGGWGYVHARDSGDFDEGFATVHQLIALGTAKKCGIKVPQRVIDKGFDHLAKTTTPDGGIIYSRTQGVAKSGMERPMVTSGAIVASLMEQDFPTHYTRTWIRFQRTKFSQRVAITSNNELENYLAALFLHKLGDQGAAKLMPEIPAKDCPQWTPYRKELVAAMLKTQQANGSWPYTAMGPIFGTALNLIVLQLDRGMLTGFQR